MKNSSIKLLGTNFLKNQQKIVKTQKLRLFNYQTFKIHKKSIVHKNSIHYNTFKTLIPKFITDKLNLNQNSTF